MRPQFTDASAGSENEPSLSAGMITVVTRVGAADTAAPMAFVLAQFAGLERSAAVEGTDPIHVDV